MSEKDSEVAHRGSVNAGAGGTAPVFVLDLDTQSIDVDSKDDVDYTSKTVEHEPPKSMKISSTLIPGRVYVIEGTRKKEEACKGGMWDMRRAKIAGADEEVILQFVYQRMHTSEVYRRRMRDKQTQGTLSALSHPHILTPVDVIEGPSYGNLRGLKMRRASPSSDEELYDVLVYRAPPEWTVGQSKAQIGVEVEVVPASLMEYVIQHGKLSERWTRKIAKQILDALGYLHANGVVHRDIGLYNILIHGTGKDPNVKVVVDPWFACAYDPTGRTLLTDAVGTTYFPAPELLRWKHSDQPSQGGEGGTGVAYVGPEIDIWNFGVVLFTLVMGRVPFDAETMEEIHEKVKSGRVDWIKQINGPGCLGALSSGSRSWFSSWAIPWAQPKGAMTSQDCKDLVQSMLTTDPTKRATLAQVTEHPWMASRETRTP